MLTGRLRDVMSFVITYQAERGFSPTQEEIMQGMGLASRSVVCHMLQRLKERGYIRHRKFAMRNIEVLKRLPTKGAILIPVTDGVVEIDRAVEIPWP